MPPVTLLGHVCTGHGCWPPRANVEGDAAFRINGKPVHCHGHAWAAHTCPAIPETHAGVLAAGSAHFRINGRAVGRIGDPVSCGSAAASGVQSFRVGP